jgi:hypothetical protein
VGVHNYFTALYNLTMPERTIVRMSNGHRMMYASTSAGVGTILIVHIKPIYGVAKSLYMQLDGVAKSLYMQLEPG